MVAPQERVIQVCVIPILEGVGHAVAHRGNELSAQRQQRRVDRQDWYVVCVEEAFGGVRHVQVIWFVEEVEAGGVGQ